MKLYNSYTQKIEPLEPIEPGKVSMYVCGPTVYNYPHVGNARPIAVFDTLKKALEAQGLNVTYVSNFTDVDDKIINTAIEQHVSEKEITDKYIKAYNQVRSDLHADLPDVTPRVTETMDQIIAFIQELIDAGAAYRVDGDVYFRVDADPKYGELSHQRIEDLMVGARIDENDKKENPLDFTLWKATDQGIQWDTPWSKGRPGWHTECVVMIQNVFQKNLIDIHGGGLDLKFPHHENEIAQCEALHHTRLANLWVHNGMINIDGTKMSKSLGNVWWANDLIKKFGGNEIRWILISTHYRAPLNLSEETFTAAEKELKRIQTVLRQADVKLQLADAPVDDAIDEEVFAPFMEALNDDLNTPNAIAVVFDTVKKLNQALRVREIDTNKVNALKNTLNKMLYILGIEFEPVQLTEADKKLYQQWRACVKAKDFEKADQYRAQLQEKGIL
ncbi:cysteine--tRNA ligase [Catenisphaera adipataccumulans]|uniref:Cysteine--tRNA ligase n=1 Tax=Catenisphaera adipataccumulans TaxID=700500 RepID=A0A7W8FXF0_9FIRM|nr:cysteine--tRNA ligase [Catenisphaera adipataccumulans]MBB5183640.1 cysteinyl-tRNA synthetase [Catenisphaera adipataccumulans]